MREVRHPPPQFILMTAYTHEERIREALEAKALAVVSKPFQVRQLLDLVARAGEA